MVSRKCQEDVKGMSKECQGNVKKNVKGLSKKCDGCVTANLCFFSRAVRSGLYSGVRSEQHGTR